MMKLEFREDTKHIRSRKSSGHYRVYQGERLVAVIEPVYGALHRYDAYVMCERGPDAMNGRRCIASGVKLSEAKAAIRARLENETQ